MTETTTGTIKTTIHAYRFDITKPADAAAYKELKAKLKKTNGECFETHGGGSHYLDGIDGQTVELQTKHLFDNQWNTDKYRVFDWAQDSRYYFANHQPKIKQGHYLEITDEMRAIRANVSKCGYCGHQKPTGDYVFCPDCIGSEYLTAELLHVTRMRPCDQGHNYTAPELTEDERAELMPLFVEAQTKGNTEREKAAIIKERASIESEYIKTIKQAKTKHDGFLWLMDNGIRTSNVIYYRHTDTFCFGWQKPLEGEILSRTLNLISEFPFRYEIKTTEGAKVGQ